jgi:hypothetical protein
MALINVSEILKSGEDLVPWIEETAIKYQWDTLGMLNRVTIKSDMKGFNERRTSEYLKSRRPQELQEDTAIPDTRVIRARKYVVSPQEFGDRYRISDRRVDTDPEDIVAEMLQQLSGNLAELKEANLIKAGLEGFVAGDLGSSSTDYTIDLPIDAQFEFKYKNRTDILYHVIHPFQAREVMKSLVVYAGAEAGTALNFREQAIRGWQVPAFDNLNIFVSNLIPRRVDHKIAVLGDGGTFRLAVMDGDEVGKNITAAITVSTTPATMVGNIKTALEALTFDGNGDWTVTGSAINNITVSYPAGMYVDKTQELRPAIDPDSPSIAEHLKSGYDLVTSPTGPVDTDGEARGFTVQEKAGAYAKSLLFFRPAILLDQRQAPTGHFDTVHQGRTGEWALYEKYGVHAWRPELGMTLTTKCESSLAV